MSDSIPSCATCLQPFAQLRQADGHAFSPPRHGDILLCSNCGTVNEVGITGILAMTEESIEALNDQEKSDLRHARKVIAHRLSRQ